jgi:uncharacterized membrane protein
LRPKDFGDSFPDTAGPETVTVSGSLAPSRKEPSMKRMLPALAALATAFALSIPAAAAAAPTTTAADDVAAQQSCFGVSLGAERNSGITGRHTVRSLTTSRGTIQLRAGYRNGQLVGWARVLNADVPWGVVMKVDLNGDRVVDVSCGADGGFDGVSHLFYASSSSNRAFKACARLDHHEERPCHPAHQTGWW